MVIQMLVVTLAPGVNCRVLSGKTRNLQGPPSLPYDPGGDCSSTVVDLPDNASLLILYQLVTVGPWESVRYSAPR